MRTTRITFDEFGKSRLWLGRQGENLATRIEIDVAEPAAQYPECTWALNVRPPRASAYPATITVADNVIVWDVTASDTAQCGAGAAELVLLGVDGEIIKSATASTGISKSLTASLGDAPEPLDDWLVEATKRLGEPPIVNEDGHWAVWQNGEYVDTGVPATGKIRSVDATISGGIGKPSVSIGYGGTEFERDIILSFYNLQGPAGQPGQDGYSPTINLTRVDDGVRIATHSADGEVQIAMVYDGKDGEDSSLSDSMNQVDAMVGSTYVKFNGPQDITLEQQNQARRNIGLYYADGVTQKQHAHADPVVYAVENGVRFLEVNFTDPDFTDVTDCTVVIDGNSYDSPVKYAEGIGVYIGNGHMIDDTLEDTGEEWAIHVAQNKMYAVSASIGSVSVYSATYDGVHTIDPMWLPAGTGAAVEYATDDEIVAELLDMGALPAIQTENGAVLCSAENTILLI